MSTDQAIADIIKYPNEERHIEFKRSVPWNGNVRATITKSTIAMANLRDGGWIVIGKDELSDRTFNPVAGSQVIQKIRHRSSEET